MKIIKEKPLSINVKNKLIKNFLNTSMGILIRNWLFQGFIYMENCERLLKLLLSLLLTIIFYIPLHIFLNLNFTLTFFISFFTSHTINWLFNGHFFVLMRYFGYKTSVEYLYNYLKRLEEIYRNNKYIDSIAIFGSISRGNLKTTSDIDVRFIPYDGLVNILFTLLIAIKERIFAFMHKIPLDLYVITKSNSLQKIRDDEINSAIVIKKGKKLEKWLGY